MERHLGLVSSGKTGVPEECVLVFGPGLFDFPSTPFNCHFLDREMDGQWVKSDRSSVSTASHHPLTHFWTKLNRSGPNSPTLDQTHPLWTKLTHRTLWDKCPDRKSSHWPWFSSDLELFSHFFPQKCILNIWTGIKWGARLIFQSEVLGCR